MLPQGSQQALRVRAGHAERLVDGRTLAGVQGRVQHASEDAKGPRRPFYRYLECDTRLGGRLSGITKTGPVVPSTVPYEVGGAGNGPV